MTDYNAGSDESGESYCVVESKDETVCPICGDGLENFLGLTVHCSHSHDATVLLRKECAECGSKMEKKVQQYNSNADRHFCDKNCLNNWRSKNLTGEDAPRWDGGDAEKPCSICGDPVKRRPSYFEEYENVTCSKECYIQLKSETSQGEDNNNYRPEVHETTTCDHCGTEFGYRKSDSEGMYCSHSCKGKDATGEDAHNWKGGWVSGDYGSNWDEQREKVLERDGWECVMCGIASDEAREKTNSPLHVHHRERKEEFRNEDGTLDYKNANSVSNLITLCVVCHGRWEEIPVQPEVI